MICDNKLSDKLLKTIENIKHSIEENEEIIRSLMKQEPNGPEIQSRREALKQEKEQLKQLKGMIGMNDSMQQLALMGITQDAKLPTDWDVGNFNNQWYVTKNGQKYKGPFNSMKAAEDWLKQVRPDFEEDNDATEGGAIEQYGKNKETETMPLEKEPIQAQDGAIVKPGDRVTVHLSEGNKKGTVTKVQGDIVEVSFTNYGTFNPERTDRYYIEQVTKDSEPSEKMDVVFEVLGKLKNNQITSQEAIKELASKGIQLSKAQEIIKTAPFSHDEEPVKDEKTYQNGEHVLVTNRETGKDVDLKVLKDNGNTLEVKAPNGSVITIKKSWIKDSEPTNAVKDSYEMLKLSGII